MKIRIIGNPIAGGGKAEKHISALEDVLQNRGHSVEACLTQSAEDVSHLTTDSLPSLDALVVAGGDGTVNAVLNALPASDSVPLFPLSVGTANMLSRELSLPTAPDSVADVLEGGEIRRLDMGIATYTPHRDHTEEKADPQNHRFLLVASVGFDAEVAHAVACRRRGALGYSGYLLPFFHVLFRHTPEKLKIAVSSSGDSKSADDTRVCTMAVISNVRNYGGIFTLTRDARCDSGRMNVCCLKAKGWWSWPLYAIKAYFGSLHRDRTVSHFQGQSIRIDTAEIGRSAPVQVDGDAVGFTPLEVRVEPGCVPVLVQSQDDESRRPNTFPCIHSSARTTYP
jgi:diacylglycerol kinase (ATP)